MKHLSILLFTICLFLVSVSIKGQNWERFGEGVTSTAYDLDGTLWYTGNGGLYHKVGNTIINYNAGNSGLQTNTLSAIAIDASGNKWVGARPGGLDKFDGVNWTHYSVDYGPSYYGVVNHLYADGNTVWIGGQYILWKYDGVSMTNYLAPPISTTAFVTDASGGLVAPYYGGVTTFNGTASANIQIGNYNYAGVIATDTQHNIWLYSDSGLVKYDGVNHFLYPYTGMQKSDVSAIYVDHNNNVWLGGSAKVHRFDGVNWSVHDTSNTDFNRLSIVSSISTDQSGNTLVTFNSGGLFSFDGVNWTDVSTNECSNHFSLYSTRCLAFGQNGDLWVGGSNGGARFNNGVITDFDFRDYGFSAGCIDMYVDSQNVVWVAGVPSVVKYSGGVWSTVPGVNEIFRSIKADSQKRMWLAGNSGLYYFDGSHYTRVVNPQIPDTIMGMDIDAQDNLWLISREGLYKVEDTTIVTYYQIQGNRNRDYLSVKIDQNNVKCIGARIGYLEFNDSLLFIIDSVPGFNLTTNTSGIAIDSQNHRWVTTGYGIMEVDHGTLVKSITKFNSPLPNGNYCFVAIDSNDFKYVAGATGGFSKFDDFNIGIPELTRHEALSVFPNPVSGICNVQIAERGKFQIEVYDVMGRLQKEKTVNSYGNENIPIDLTGLVNGVYVISLRGNNVNKNASVVKVQ